MYFFDLINVYNGNIFVTYKNAHKLQNIPRYNVYLGKELF